MAGKIYIDNVDIYANYGVLLVKSQGELDLLKVKKPVLNDWNDEHGQEVDLSAIFYQPRKITLEFVIKAGNVSDFLTKLQGFYDFLQAPGLRQLRYEEITNRVYLVYSSAGAQFRRLVKWNQNTNTGRFTVSMIEPEPVSLQYITDQSTLATVQITLDTTKYLTIYWGDGSSEAVSPGTGVTLTHDYSQTGTYYIVLAGDISVVSNVVLTNCSAL